MTTKIYKGKAEDVIAQYNEEQALIEEEITDVQNVMATVASEYSDERDLVNQLLGQVQMARSFSKFADVVSLTKLAHIKESKIYRTLTGKEGVDFDGNKIADIGTWDGFCQALGLSRSKVDEDLINLNIFGEDALKQLSAIGAGYRELRQYRKLPEDEKTALIEVAKAGDKEALVELAEEFISKHTKEKEELKKKVDDSQADYNALQKRNTDLSKEKESLSLKLNKFELKTIPMDERLEPLKAQIAETQSQIDTLFNEHRQYVELLEKLQFEAMESDPDYDAENPWHLPEALQTTLMTLHGALVLTLSQAKSMHQSLWLKLGDDLDLGVTEEEAIINSTRNAD